MTEAVSTVREAPLPELQSFCRALAQALSQAGLEAGEVAVAFRVGLDAECTRCGIRVWGEELFALWRPPSAEHSSAKVGRLRLGYCARDGCQSAVYRLTLWNSPTLDWRVVMPKAEAMQQGQEEKTAPQAALCPQVPAPAIFRRAARSGLAYRVAVALAVGALLFLVWQWRRGGRIPILREPEHFRVTVAPAGEE